MTGTIYEKLHEITVENLPKDMENPLYSAELTNFYAEHDPHVLDVMEFSKVQANNEEFLHLAYLAFFNRPVDDKAMESWKRKFPLPQDAFRTQVLETLSASEEMRVVDKKLLHNLYAENEKCEDIFVKPRPIINTMVKAYHKLPEPVKNIVRKARGTK